MTGERVSLSTYYKSVLWCEPHGLIAYDGTRASSGTYKNDVFGVIQPDGTFVSRSSKPHNSHFGVYSDFFDKSLLVATSSQALVRVNPLTGTTIETVFSGPGWTASHLAFTRTKVYRVSGTALQESPRQTTPAWATIATLTSPGTASFGPKLSLDRDGKLYIGYDNGVILIYDTVTAQQLTTKYIDATLANGRGVWYAAKYDVFLSLHYNSGDQYHYLRVWATTPRPSQLSAPTALSAVQRGRATTYRVQLRGSNNEACPGETVSWSLAGAGILLEEQSTTDASGYATTRVIAPVGSLPTLDLTATVKF